MCTKIEKPNIQLMNAVMANFPNAICQDKNDLSNNNKKVEPDFFFDLTLGDYFICPQISMS